MIVKKRYKDKYISMFVVKKLNIEDLIIKKMIRANKVKKMATQKSKKREG